MAQKSTKNKWTVERFYHILFGYFFFCHILSIGDMLSYKLIPRYSIDCQFV